MEGQMRRREKGYTYQLPFQNGFWKLPQNISACISLARSFLVTWPHLAARKARKYCLYSRWPNAHSESELLVLREKGSVDIGTQKFLSPSETFASEMVQGSHPSLLMMEKYPLIRQIPVTLKRFRSHTYIIVCLVFKVFGTLKRLFFGILEYEQISLVTPI